MPSVTLTCEADASGWESPKYAAGLGNHLPVGHYGSADYHSILRFDAPAWSGWTGITKATLNIYTSDFDHVGPRNSSIYVRRQSLTSGTSAPVWTGSEGSQSCESGFATGSPDIDNMNAVTTGQASFSSGTTANAKKSVVVTTMVDYYRSAGSGKITFVLSPVGSGDYAEFWSRHKSGGYDITLVIEYEDNVVPTAPTLVSPASGATVVPQTPTFDWTHNDPDGDPQASAQVRVWDAAGTTQVGSTATIAGTSSIHTWGASLTRGTTYQWDVRTADATGYGPWSSKRSFTVKALPVVTVSATRYMEMSGGAPRLRVKWSVTGGTQTKYRVQAGVYDSGWVTSTATERLLGTLALTNGTAVTVTVTIETSDVLQDSDSQAFTPRWGLTVHRRDLGTDPVTGWGTPTVASTVPSGASLVIEYGSSATAVAAPSTWYSSLSSVPKARYVFYRAWFIPSNSAGPTLSSIVIPAMFAAERVDHWFATNAATTPIASPWSVDTGEYVYGTRSITCENNGSTAAVWSERIRVRAGRSYILTGLMRAEGNSGAVFQLYDADAVAVLTNDLGAGIQSEVLAASREWFEADALDVYRYRTPVWVAPADMDVQVRLRSLGAVGTQSWFDGLKLEESTVATPWSPAAIGAVSLDAGGVQIDGTKGGVFRLKGSTGGLYDVVEGSPRGLRFGTGIEVHGTNADELRIDASASGSAMVATMSPSSNPGVYSAFLSRMVGDTSARLVVGRSGDVERTGMFIGPGNAARDTSFYRIGVGIAGIDSDLRVSATVAIQGVISPSLTANQNDWNPSGGADAFHWRLINDATVRIITGIIGPSHVQGRLLWLHNNSTVTNITIANESASSITSNRILCPANTDFTLRPRASALLIYDGTSSRWRLLGG